MNFNVVTVFPEMIDQLTAWGVLGQAKKKGLLNVRTINPREFTHDVHRTVDDRPFGGGDGMILLYEPMAQAIKSIAETGRVIYLSPQGRTFSDQMAQELSREKNLTFICGRYGGLDQRVINQFVDEEVSIGDYVLSGGELAAGVIIDGVARFLPGVLGHGESVFQDSFRGGVLEAPQFSRPRLIESENGTAEVPQILFSGHHANILEWRKWVGLIVTWQKRRDILSQIDAGTLAKMRDFWHRLSLEEKKSLGIEKISWERE